MPPKRFHVTDTELSVMEVLWDRGALIQERLRHLSASLCDGSVMPMLSGLIKPRRWTTVEQKELRQLLSEIIDAKSSVRKN